MQKTPSTKRVRRPSVRLNQPYYENPSGHRKLQQQWNAFKQDLELAKKARSKKHDETVNVEELEVDEDDNVAIGNWKKLNAGNRDKDFKSKAKRKRARPSSSTKKWGESDENQENGGFHLSSGGEIEKKQGEEGNDEVEVEENLGANGVSSPNRSFPGENLSDDDDENNVGGIDQGRELMNGRDSNGVGGEMKRIMGGESDGDRGGVRGWLGQLGLSKYASLFEVHEVDDEVLPFLTLEDLKDMGINAVGSRRKMYRSIQKLGKGV